MDAIDDVGKAFQTLGSADVKDPLKASVDLKNFGVSCLRWMALVF